MKIGIVFPGYGSQFVGMGKDFYDESRVVQEYFEEANNCLGTNFVKLCFASSDQELSEIPNAYAAIFLVEVALYSVLLENGIKADQVAGLCIGRYAALFAAGGFSFPDGLYLLKKYAQFYSEALGTLDPKVIRITGISITIYNRVYNNFIMQVPDAQLALAVQYSKTDFMLSGPRVQVELFEQELKQLKIKKLKIQDLNLAYDLHSMAMSGVADRLAEYLIKVDFKELKLPYISGISGKVIKTSKQIRTELISQITKPILWHKVQTQFADCDMIIEVGPSAVLTAGLQQLYPDKLILSFTKLADLDVIKEKLAQNNLNNSLEASNLENNSGANLDQSNLENNNNNPESIAESNHELNRPE
jgi:[acyl-carrier-protein] S-malonyltransferase